MREMCGKKEDEGECSQTTLHTLQTYQEQLLLQQQLQHQQQYSEGSGLLFPQVSPIIPWNFPQPQSFNPLHFSSNSIHDHHDPFYAPPPTSSYGALFNRTRGAPSLQFAYEGSTSDHHLRILSDQLGQMGHHHNQSRPSPFGLQSELAKMSAQEIMDAKALAASKSHSEAERRRRERINNHLAKLRSLLPSTAKTDKASLLAEVIQHVKELKRQTSQIAEASPVPTETDEVTVDASDDENGKFIIKASICCEDRSDLLPELIKTLKALKLKTLKAEITTLGGRVKNVLFITSEDQQIDQHQEDQHEEAIHAIQEALKAVMERTSSDDSSSGSIKRQRTNNINLLEHQERPI